MNGTMLYRHKLCKDIFWCFWKDESFVSKTLNEGHVEYVELSKVLASTVCQLAKSLKVPKL